MMRSNFLHRVVLRQNLWKRHIGINNHGAAQTYFWIHQNNSHDGVRVIGSKSCRPFTSKRKSSETEFALLNMLETSTKPKVNSSESQLNGKVVDVKEGFVICDGLLGTSLNQLTYLVDSKGVIKNIGIVIALEFNSTRVMLLQNSGTSGSLLLGCDVLAQSSVSKRDFKFGIKNPFVNRERPVLTVDPLGFDLQEQDDHHRFQLPNEASEEEKVDVFPRPKIGDAFTKIRSRINTQLHSGIRLLDSLFPFGYGERIAWIGELGLKKRELAKSLLAMLESDSIDDVIWVSLGQTSHSTLALANTFESSKTSTRFTIISANASQPWGMQWLAPYSATALGERLMLDGRKVLVVFEGMTAFGAAHERFSIAQGANPSNHAQPHASFLERFMQRANGGSMTALCIFDTDESSQSDKMRDNAYGTVDSAIEFDRSMFLQRFFPAINCMNIGKCSVQPFQHRALAELAIKIKGIMFELAELQNSMDKASQIGINLRDEMDLDFELNHARNLQSFFCRQDPGKHFPIQEEIIHLFAVSKSALEKIREDEIEGFLNHYLSWTKNTRYNELSGDVVAPISVYEAVANLSSAQKISDSIKLESVLTELLESSLKSFKEDQPL